MGAVRVGMLRKQHLSWSADHALLHPLWWASLGSLVLNDHYLKGSGMLTGWVTGKLSDFAGMLMAPVVVAALLRARTRLRFAAAHALVGLAFSALKLSASAAELWCRLGGQLGWHWQVIADPSDLAALPLLAVSFWLFGPRFRVTDAPVAWRRVGTGTGLLLGLSSIVATSRIPPRPPVLGPRAVYVPVGRQLQELERASGRPLRRMACELAGGRAEVAGDTLIERLFDGELRACDLTQGQMAWKHELGEGAELVAGDAQRVLARSPEHVWALEPQTGAVLWQLGTMNHGVALLDGRLFVRRRIDRLFVHSPADGARSAESDLPFPSSRPFADIAHPLGVLLAQVPYPPDGVDAIDAANGELLWQMGAQTRAVAANGDLVFTQDGAYCAKNLLTARAARSGRAIWSIPWCPPVSSVSADRELVVTWSYGSENSVVVARRPADGGVLWSATLDR